MGLLKPHQVPFWHPRLSVERALMAKTSLILRDILIRLSDGAIDNLPVAVLVVALNHPIATPVIANPCHLTGSYYQLARPDPD